jgi:hypothetical protein
VTGSVQKARAQQAVRDYAFSQRERGREARFPEKLIVNTRAERVQALNSAMGVGMSETNANTRALMPARC